MPIFMDRHDMRGMTAEDVAVAHHKDLNIQDQYGVKYMTYWFDRDRGTNFCLTEAPDAATAERVHRESHGQIATDIIAVDLALIEAFLGRIGDPKMTPDTVAAIDSGLRAVMFTDIVGSTEMTARLGDAAALELGRVQDALVRRGLAAHRGREVKHTGDGIMAVFDDVARAVRAAADIQWHFSAYNCDAAESLSVRIGIHAVSRWRITMTFSGQRYSSPRGCVARPRWMGSSSPGLCASCVTWMLSALSRSASDG